jgi:RNA polymerase-binding transcription factor DksA
MKARCANCRALRDIDYPISRLDWGAFTIAGKCAVCGGYLEQKRRVVVA